MKRLISIILPLSLLAFVSNPVHSNSKNAASTRTTFAQNKQENNATVNLVSPESQTEVPMGEVEIILEVVDSNGEPVKVESLDVSASMPMEGMEDMMGKVEVTPTEGLGRFKATTYFGMQGTWYVFASVKDPQYQGQQEFTFEVK